MVARYTQRTNKYLTLKSLLVSSLPYLFSKFLKEYCRYFVSIKLPLRMPLHAYYPTSLIGFSANARYRFDEPIIGNSLREHFADVRLETVESGGSVLGDRKHTYKTMAIKSQYPLT